MSDVSHTEIDLPEFRHPPVVEVAASIQFSPIAGLDAAHLGALWLRFRERYPKTEQHSPLATVTETFATPRPVASGLSVEQRAFPTPRFWFVDQTNTRVVQVQKNRLVVNWRQADTEANYPRYTTLREDIEAAFNILRDFLIDEGLEEPTPELAELTYVNHLHAGERGKPRDSISRFLRYWQEPAGTILRSSPEEASLRAQYVMQAGGQPVGRLYVELESAYRRRDNAPIYILNMIARGAVADRTLNGTLAFLDQAHFWIVRGFTDITTSEMHDIWERIQ